MRILIFIPQIWEFLFPLHFVISIHKSVASNAGLQLRRAISIQAEGTKLLEKHAIAPSAARLCWTARLMNGANWRTRAAVGALLRPLLLFFSCVKLASRKYAQELHTP